MRPGDDVASARLRLLALQRADGEDLSRLDDHDLQARLEAWHGRAESLGTDPDPPALMRLASAPAAGEAAAVAAAGPRRSAPVEPAAPAETTFGADVDAEAMAQALVQAAQDGVPFCEECARAAARAAAGGAGP
ncbi:MAG: hypothetical protein KGJ24_01185 [Burkholderiales bacterium]|nr:hypothetical protein [Burkholderiales bacterium]